MSLPASESVRLNAPASPYEHTGRSPVGIIDGRAETTSAAVRPRVQGLDGVLSDSCIISRGIWWDCSDGRERVTHDATPSDLHTTAQHPRRRNLFYFIYSFLACSLISTMARPFSFPFPSAVPITASAQ
jgi:hypothetical protein